MINCLGSALAGLPVFSIGRSSNTKIIDKNDYVARDIVVPEIGTQILSFNPLTEVS
jgi:hypothetical protein